MKKIVLASALAVSLFTVSGAGASGVYIGAGFPGYTVGYDYTYSPSIAFRGEYTGGLSVSRDSTRDGINYSGKFKGSAFGAFADYYFLSDSGLRATGGLTVNDIKVNLSATGRNGSVVINGRNVNLANGDSYDVKLKYPSVTPYLGIGYNSNRAAKQGWGFVSDLGVMIGRFDTSASSSLVARMLELRSAH